MYKDLKRYIIVIVFSESDSRSARIPLSFKLSIDKSIK